MLPNPTRPTVLRNSSWPPANRFFSHRPDLVEAMAGTSCRRRTSIMPMVSSATATEFPPGVFITTTPFRVAASTSMLSTPTPARPMTFSRPGCSMVSAVTLVALRTASTSY